MFASARQNGRPKAMSWSLNTEPLEATGSLVPFIPRERGTSHLFLLSPQGVR